MTTGGAGRRGRWSGRGGAAGRGGCLVTIAKVLGALAVVVIVIVLLWYLLAGCFRPAKPPKPPVEPDKQSASCPDVEVIAVPGTWESSSTDDPIHPKANPQSLLLGITKQLQQQFAPARAEVYTVPYVAQFSNPIAIPPDGQQSYNNSRTEGMQRTTEKLADTAQKCPLTSYVLIGFSQGAVIMGDVVADIGANKGPVRPDRVLGVTLIADGRRQLEQGRPVGVPTPGTGAEIALGGLQVPGITMTGPRVGFGVLNDKVNTICAPGDLICAAPKQALNPFNLLSSVSALVQSARKPVHAAYAGYPVEPGGPTSTQWTTGWAAGLIQAAPRPLHY